MSSEEVYTAVAAGDWAGALHAAHADRSDSAVSVEARRVLVDSLLGALAGEGPQPGDDHLEKALLMQHAGYLDVSGSGLDLIAETLVNRNRTLPERAARYARFRPEAEACRAVLAQFGSRDRVDASTEAGRITDVTGAPRAGLRSVFRSSQERVLFQAARRVFPGCLVVPNAALSSALDFNQIRGMLSREESETFFRALVDLIVFNPSHDFRAELFLELDSPWHDDPHRGQRDNAKERMIALAGGHLVRLRTTGQIGLAAMVALLEEAAG
ncbi:MAG: hypothetical protein JJ896_05785 [Rhodothermales bacterium]|nr:hypothetical protein [Rhodothermales bacterium]MBO6779142.1 hypothetical protein [Rhodothermales bacterium]